MSLTLVCWFVVQGDLISRASSSTSSSASGRSPLTEKKGAEIVKGRGLSASSESISSTRQAYTSGTSSPSKLSIASSSDSLGSNLSVATVKNMAAASVGEESTPPLPPRNSPTRVVMRPPLPAHPNQVLHSLQKFLNFEMKPTTGSH